MNSEAAHPSFEQLRVRRIDSLDIDITEYKHKKTGTPHFHLATDNPENVFLVGLRTVPQDSTGVAHILEHTVLCGSEKYPVRDPFFMMIRRSLNTFMNAFTSTDWTAYPFATQNRKDYFNLLDVYLDAVFFSRLDELDFAQEGHRIEFEEADNSDSDLVFKGVVFNEMKGAMSAPTSTLWQTLTKHTYPNNTYHYNSGGEPENILDLSYQQLKDFYDTHYHPSNAVFMTFGDIPATELQNRFDEHVLQRFEPLDRTIQVRKTQRYYAPIAVEEAYASDESESDGNTHVVVAWLLGESTDLDARLRAHLVSNVLLDNSASPLQKILETNDLGSSPSPLCGISDSNREMLFACGMEGTDVSKAEQVEEMIMEVLRDIADNGVPQHQIDAVLHQLELSQREIGGDGMPFGLQLVLNGLSTAMLRGDTMEVLDLDPALARLREEVATKPDFVQNEVRKLFLDNAHRVRLSLRPDTKLSDLRALAEKQRLEDTKAGLSNDEKQVVIDKAKALAERQKQEDDPEILPKVSLEDIPADIHIASGTERELSGSKAAFYAQGTNGIVYQDLVIDMPALDDDLLELLPYYSSFLAELGSGGRDYLETQALQSSVTGSFGAYTLQKGSIDDANDVNAYFVISGKALVRNHASLVGLMQDTLDDTRFDEVERIRELFAQSRAAREQSVTGSGHALAMSAAASGISSVAALSHRLHGLQGISNLKQLDDSLNDPAALQAVVDKFARLHQAIGSAPRRHMIISEEEHHDAFADNTESVFDKASAVSSDFEPFKFSTESAQINQLWTTNTEVNFCSKAYPAVPATHPDAAALTVLGPFLRNGFLHRNIRETGGAYGGGASYDSGSASMRFYSYRDPRLGETLSDFDDSIDWLTGSKHEWRGVEESILNIVSSIDKPHSPSGTARSAYQAELVGRTPTLRKQLRDNILKVTLEDLQRVGETYLKKELANMAAVCSESVAQENKNLDAENVAL